MRTLFLPLWAITLSTLVLCDVVSSAQNQQQQQPLGPNSLSSSHLPSPGQSLNFSSPHPHLLHSTASLLSQWPNTFFPNGHALAAVTVPPFTPLYHGRTDALPPPSPEWLAFDREMSVGIMGSTRDSHLLTYQTTRPVRMLYFDGESAALMGLGQLDSQMLVAFGNVTGPEGEAGRGRGLWGEYERASGLCGWLRGEGLGGRGWGFEGVVRMNAGFEVIWCDFGSGSLRLVGWVNVTAPLLGEAENEEGEEGEEWDVGNSAVVRGKVEGMVEGEAGDELKNRGVDSTSYYPLPPVPTRTDRAVDPSTPPAPPNWRRDRDREPFLVQQGWGWFDSATWHYGASGNKGETRAKVDSCAILSFYSDRFANQSLNRAVVERKALNLTDDGLWKGEGKGNKTLALLELARRRRFHHLGDVTPDEGELMRDHAKRSLSGLLKKESGCSEADWVGMASEIVQQTGMRIKMLEMKLAAVGDGDKSNDTALRTWFHGFRAELHGFTVGFLVYPRKASKETWTVGTELFNETYSRCRYHYTRLLAPDQVSLLPEEMEQRQAVEEVQGGICSVMLTIAFGVEKTWAEVFNKNAKWRKPSHALSGLTQRVLAWHDDLSLLRAWLGWESDFTGCKTVCAWDERCYIPMWPLMSRARPGGDHHPPPPYGRHPPQYGPPPNGSYPGRPGFKIPPRGPWWMGDDTDLWEPKCVEAKYIMG